jgi:hypothetical protein
MLAAAIAVFVGGSTVPAAEQGAPPPPAPVQQPFQGGRGQQPTRDARAQAAIGTGLISGTVVTEGTGTPVRRARVTLSGGELRGGRSTITNDDGVFTFAALPAGRFNLSASKAGYVDIAYGARRPGRPGTPIQLLDGQKLEKATIHLPRGSVITGIVVDEHGEPAPRTQVRVMRYVMRTGERTLQQGGSDQTDDRGIYRIYGLQPGEYLVTATPSNTRFGDMREALASELETLLQQARAAGDGGRGGGGGGGGRGGRGAGQPPILGAGGGRGQAIIERAELIQQQIAQQEQEQPTAYAPVYYPGTTSASSASAVTLAIGEERAGVDFQLQLVATARIEGSVVNGAGTLPPGVQVQLMPADMAGLPRVPGMGTSMSRVGQDGRFSFSNVTPGQYRLQARATVREQQNPAAAQQQQQGGRGGRGRGQGPVTQILWASTDIGVGGQDLEDLVLQLQPGMSITGRVTFEGSLLPPPPDLTRVRVNLVPRGQQSFGGGNSGPTQMDATGRFTIAGVPPGSYTLAANVPGGGRGGGGLPAGAQGGATASWVLKSASAAGRDVLDFPFVVEPNQDVSGALLTFSDRTQEVSGVIQDTQGQPTAGFTIIIFPSDSRYWQPQSRRVMATRPGTDGRFSFRNLPAGDYRLTAVIDVEPGEWFNPDFLSQLGSASIPLSLAEGERKVQDIRLAGGGGGQ